MCTAFGGGKARCISGGHHIRYKQRIRLRLPERQYGHIQGSDDARELNYAIIDEVDSILIDEARTPLIISGKGDDSTDMYKRADGFVRTLKPGEDADFTIEEKDKQIALTDEGVAQV